MKEKSQTAIAFDRLLTLAALVAASAAYYGLRVLTLSAVAVTASMLTEFICLYARKIPFRFQHIEAAAIGLLLTMLMPPTISYPVLIISCIFAIIIGRQIFGGDDNPTFPAAAVGYVFALFTWKDAVLSMPAEPFFIPIGNLANMDLTESTSALWNTSGKIIGESLDWLLCIPKLPFGSASLLMLGTILIILILRRTASPMAVSGMMFMLILMNIFTTAPQKALGAAVFACLTNTALLSAIYLIGDVRLVPRGIAGLCYGMLCGFICFYMTRTLHIENAPVIVSVFMQPLAALLKDNPIMTAQKGAA